MTDPIKLAIEALEWADSSLIDGLPMQVKTQEAIAALRSIKPPCQMCIRFTVGMETGRERCTLLAQDCTNYDKFQAMDPVCLTKEK